MFLLRLLPFAFGLLAGLHPASAAESAKSMFGVELGSRFAIPACARGEASATRRLCRADTPAVKTAWGSEEHRVHYPHSASAPYARGEMVIDVVSGIIEAVHVDTWGIQAQNGALEALTKKYGPPARSRAEKIAAHRSRYPTRFAEWEFADYGVRLDGTTTTIDWGRITIATRRHRQAVRAHDAAR